MAEQYFLGKELQVRAKVRVHKTHRQRHRHHPTKYAQQRMQHEKTALANFFCPTVYYESHACEGKSKRCRACLLPAFVKEMQPRQFRM